jgi:hypothetical protein
MYKPSSSGWFIRVFTHQKLPKIPAQCRYFGVALVNGLRNQTDILRVILVADPGVHWFLGKSRCLASGRQTKSY